MKKYSNTIQTGSFNLYGSIQATALDFTASHAASASFALEATSASFATTASYHKTMYANVARITDATSAGTGTDIVWNQTIKSSEITISGAVITLPPGTWKFEGVVNAYNFSITDQGYLNVDVVNSTNNAVITGISQVNPGPPTALYNYSQNTSIIGIISTATSLGVKLRVTSANGTATISGAATRLLITSLDT